MESLECAILLDIENILFAACDDAAASGASKNKLAGYIIGHVSELAQGYAPPACAEDSAGRSVRSYAALGFARKQKNVSWISFALAKAGFRTMIVPAGPNAADVALRDLGLLLAVDNTVGTVILATGDGREPFPELLEILLGCGKRVHVVSYDGAPFSMHIEGVEHSSLAPHLRIFLESASDDVSSSAHAEEAEEPPHAAAPEAEASAAAVGGTPLEAAGITQATACTQRTYREAARAILNGTSLEGLERPAENLVNAYKIFVDDLVFPRPDHTFSFGRLRGVLEAAKAAGRLQAASDEEVGWIAKALVNFTDAFDRVEMYVRSANRRFEDLIRVRANA